MKIINKIRNKQYILLGIFFILFFLSYTRNVFLISEPDLFHGFERQPEGLVIGRLARSAQDGVFSYGGLNGVNSSDSIVKSPERYAQDLAAQHDLYIMDSEVPPYFIAYKSQSAGQAIVMGTIHKLLPYDNLKKLATYRGLNALLVAFIFVLFGAWVYRNYGFVASLITLLLVFLSPWINVFAHNLWWVLWNFYIPFLTMLLLLERRHKNPDKISQPVVVAGLFFAVFFKCFFSGFEFISTTLISALCPFVYYAIREKQHLKSFLLDGIKYSGTMLMAVLAQMLMLIVQIKHLEGTYKAGIDHIINSFVKRSDVGTDDVKMSLFELIKVYLKGDAFQLGFLQNDTPVFFGVVILLIVAGLLFIGIRKKEMMSDPLILTTLFSILAPLSWLIVFKQHSIEHIHMDYIIWYIPFMLYGFCAIGVAVSLLWKKKERV